MPNKTKICPYCKAEIDDNAYICPNCKKAQPADRASCLTAVIIVAVMFVLPFKSVIFPTKNKTTTEPTQQIIAEETTTEATEATEQPTEPPTETKPETIPETVTEAATEPETEIIPIELDSLQKLFVSLKNDTTIEEIDRYIENNGLVKSAFTGNSAYYIGYENRAVLQRERDRIGNAIDINFFTSGNTDLIGKVKSAKYKSHNNTYISKYTLMFQDDCFYIETSGEKKYMKTVRKLCRNI